MAAENAMFAEPMDVLGQLDRMGLKDGQLRRAIQFAATSLGNLTKHNPPTSRGFQMWSMANRGLRDELVPSGWTASDSSRFPRTIHPLEDYAITVVSGTYFTGLTSGMPHTKRERPRGTVLRSLIGVNSQLQIADFVATFDRVNRPAELVPTWILLHYIDEDEVRMELSFPRVVNPKGVVVSFNPRIILKPLALTPEQLTKPIADPDPVIVPVTLKAEVSGNA